MKSESALQELAFQALDSFQIEIPSWGFANTGTRFGKFVQAAAASTLEEKFSDAGQVHKLTGVTPTLALHVLWDLPNGISNANGVVTFNGTEAVIQNLSGETGGGKLALSGFVAYGGPEMQFRIQANADAIHVAYPPTVTTQAAARLSLAGTTSRARL